MLRIEGNLNSNTYVREVLEHEVVAFLQRIPGTIFQQNNACSHVVKTVGDFCLAQYMQLLPWPTYSLDMSPTEQVWDLDCRRLPRNLRSAYLKGKLWLRIQAIWNYLPQADVCRETFV